MTDAPDTGMYYDIPYGIYDQWPALRKTHLWVLNEETPLDYRDRLDHPDAYDSPSLAFGRMFHAAVCEPETFERDYVAPPPPPDGAETWDRRTKAHKEAWAEWVDANAGRTVIAQDEYDAMRHMRDAVWSHETARMLLDAGKTEVSMLWRDAQTDLLLKGRIDLWIPSGVVVDFKSARHCAPRRFGKDAYGYGYHYQMAMYRDGAIATSGVEVAMPILIAVGKERPWHVAVYELDPDQVGMGMAQYRHTLGVVKECMEADRWPGYDTGVMSLPFPAYAGTELYAAAI